MCCSSIVVAASTLALSDVCLFWGHKYATKPLFYVIKRSSLHVYVRVLMKPFLWSVHIFESVCVLFYDGQEYLFYYTIVYPNCITHSIQKVSGSPFSFKIRMYLHTKNIYRWNHLQTKFSHLCMDGGSIIYVVLHVEKNPIFFEDMVCMICGWVLGLEFLSRAARYQIYTP